jgi:hypothetical protein
VSLDPKGEKLRKAVRWISQQRVEEPERSVGALVSDASQRFDLSPVEADFLQRFVRAGGGDLEADPA